MKNYEQTTLCFIAPSPLVGEGNSAGRRAFDWVRGSLAAFPIRTLTRLRFAKPPSPTGEEGDSQTRSA
jgi:hypothetical protein